MAQQADDTKLISRNGIQVIARAAAVLRSLKDAPSGLSLGQIAERVGLPRSTVQRIVGALQEERLVIMSAQGGGLRLGPELTALAASASTNIVETCRLYLSDIAQTTGETADLSVMRGDKMIFLDQVPGTHRLRTVSSVGEVFPLTTTANGRSCLAALPEDQALALIGSEFTRRGIAGNPEDFLASLGETRTARLAYDRNEHTDGISAIGFAFRDWSGDLHAISVPIPSTRFADKRMAVEAALRKTQEQLERLMREGPKRS